MDPIKSLIQIDMLRLDEHWAYQTKLYHKWAARIPEAKEKLALAKANVELVEAQMSKRIRDAPEKYGLDKTTEPAIKAAVMASAKVRKSIKKRIRMQRLVDDLEVGVNTAEVKKKSLEKLVDLEARDYFSSPRAPKHVPPEMKKHLKESKRRMIRNKGRRDDE